ncbi:alpha/beta hydrolase [Massilia sp. METH4]|uniref:alpha/beta fold hydrolase n=1 Tax=Massilia sp. METH4 TaxID=3123041 RepID=UPI0030D1D6A7
MVIDFVPGTLCDERLWYKLLPLLPAGFGARHVPLYGARTRAQMQELIATHTAPRAHIVAFSMGAYLALEHALAHPDRVASLVLIAASARGLGEEEKERRRRTMAALETQPFAGMPPSQLRGFVHPPHLHDPSIAGVIHQMALDLGKETMLAQFEASMERADLMERLHELRCPVLFVGGEFDQKVPADDLREMSDRVRQSCLGYADDSGHMVPLEAPEELADDLYFFYSSFLEEPVERRTLTG